MQEEKHLKQTDNYIHNWNSMNHFASESHPLFLSHKQSVNMSLCGTCDQQWVSPARLYQQACRKQGVLHADLHWCGWRYHASIQKGPPGGSGQPACTSTLSPAWYTQRFLPLEYHWLEWLVKLHTCTQMQTQLRNGFTGYQQFLPHAAEGLILIWSKCGKPWNLLQLLHVGSVVPRWWFKMWLYIKHSSTNN